MDNMILKLDDTIVEVQMDDNGRYCLNDIYKASGKGDSNKPAKWLRSKMCGVSVVNLNGTNLSRLGSPH